MFNKIFVDELTSRTNKMELTNLVISLPKRTSLSDTSPDDNVVLTCHYLPCPLETFEPSKPISSPGYPCKIRWARTCV